MHLEMSEECATTIAALRSWIDPIGYILSEDGLLEKYVPLRSKEARGLLTRLVVKLNAGR